VGPNVRFSPMPILRPPCLLLGLLLLVSLACQAAGGLRYPDNLAWRLVTEQEVQQITGCPERLGDEKREAPALFEEPAAPLAAIEAIPDETPVMTVPQTSWEVAPFPTLDPPLPQGIRSDRVTPAGREPVVFSDISTRIGEAPSAALRPRPTALGQQLLGPRSRLPNPFTLRRYHARDRGFFQIALYGGSSGLEAERDYRTLRTAAPNRRTLDGVGSQAFLSVVPLAPESATASEPGPTPSPSPSAPPRQTRAFADLAPFGRPRWDLLDKGLIQARSAPAFQSIPVDLGLPEGLGANPEPVAAPSPTPSPSPPPAVEPPFDGTPDLPTREAGTAPDPDPFGGTVDLEEGGVQVLVAFFPDKGVVLELAMDPRLGDIQALIRVAFLVQSRLLQRW